MVAPTMACAINNVAQLTHQTFTRQEIRRVSTYSSLPDFKVKFYSAPLSITSERIDKFNYEDVVKAAAFRETTKSEELIGELRGWTLLHSNWDGEGALAPSVESITQAVEFSRMLNDVDMMPEPMILPSGNASLYWNDGQLYAEIEFLGAERLAYFVKRNGDVHKGVIKFNSQKVPAVLSALIWSQQGT